MNKFMLLCLLFISINNFFYCSIADDASLAIENAPINNFNPNQQQSVIPDTPATDSNKPPINKKVPVRKIPLTKKIISIPAALLIGTPVCIVRRTKYEEGYEVKGFMGDSNNKCKKVLASIVCFPYALVCGTGEAPFDALANGLMYTAFSKDQLSQGKLIQNN